MEDTIMEAKYYINGLRVLEGEARAMVNDGARFDRIMNDAEEAFRNDPCEELEYMIGGGRMLTIEFD